MVPGHKQNIKKIYGKAYNRDLDTWIVPGQVLTSTHGLGTINIKTVPTVCLLSIPCTPTSTGEYDHMDLLLIYSHY